MDHIRCIFSVRCRHSGLPSGVLTESRMIGIKPPDHKDADLLAVSSRRDFLNEHHWSFGTVGSALDDEPQACSLGDTYQLNDTVTEDTEREAA